MSPLQKENADRLRSCMNNHTVCSAYCALAEAIAKGKEFAPLQRDFQQQLQGELPNDRSMFRSPVTSRQAIILAKEITDMVVAKWQEYAPQTKGKNLLDWGAPSGLPGAVHGAAIIRSGGGICM